MTHHVCAAARTATHDATHTIARPTLHIATYTATRTATQTGFDLDPTSEDDGIARDITLFNSL